MDLSIVILNYKSAKLTRQCVKTIKLYEPVFSYEIIVVDNASGDGVAEMLQRHFPEVRFIQTGANLGYAGGNNVGIREASGRHILVMNPDITVTAGAIDEMVRHLDAHPEVGILGPRLLKPDGGTDESCYRFPTPLTPIMRRTPLGQTAFGRRELKRYLMADFDRRTTRPVDWLLGAVLMIRREALEKVGPFDDRYFLYFEDTDLCRRYWQAGWQVVYFVGAEMVHYHERLSAQGSWFTSLTRKSTRIHLASATKYFRKWGLASLGRGRGEPPKPEPGMMK